MSQANELATLIQSGDLDGLKALLAVNPALAHTRDEQGITPIMRALYGGRKEMAEAIAQAKDALDIFEAASLNQAGRVRELLAQDRSLAEVWSTDGFTPLHFACFFGAVQTANLLLKSGVRVDEVSRNTMQVMPLHSAAAGRTIAIVRDLLAHGAPPNATQQGGWTALHSAAQSGDTGMIELLLKHGADPQAKNDDGITPQELALEKGHAEVARRLAAA